MAQLKHPPGPPMDLANMRRQGVHHLIAYCLNDSCRHQAMIDVSSYPGDTLVPWFRSKVTCAKCGARHNRIDVRPNWNEAPGSVDGWRGRQLGKRRNGHTPRGYPYNSKTCAGGFRACVNHYLKVGWRSPEASSYCSHACAAKRR
jgi:hypothetical protein